MLQKIKNWLNRKPHWDLDVTGIGSVFPDQHVGKTARVLLTSRNCGGASTTLRNFMLEFIRMNPMPVLNTHKQPTVVYIAFEENLPAVMMKLFNIIRPGDWTPDANILTAILQRHFKSYNWDVKLLLMYPDMGSLSRIRYQLHDLIGEGAQVRAVFIDDFGLIGGSDMGECNAHKQLLGLLAEYGALTITTRKLIYPTFTQAGTASQLEVHRKQSMTDVQLNRILSRYTTYLHVNFARPSMSDDKRTVCLIHSPNDTLVDVKCATGEVSDCGVISFPRGL